MPTIQFVKAGSTSLTKVDGPMLRDFDESRTLTMLGPSESELRIEHPRHHFKVTSARRL
jgi:hypothetical protein